MSDEDDEPYGYIFTDEDRSWVRTVAPYLKQEQIARKLEISLPTLRKHFRRELDLGEVEAHAEVGKFLLSQARENLSAAIFFAKTQMGWKEARASEGDGPTEHVIKIVGGLTDAG